MITYTIYDARKLGEPHPEFGQTWWAIVEEDVKPLKFSTMSNTEFVAGDTVSCEESFSKRSTKGTDYLQGKKVRLITHDVPQRPQMPLNNTPSTASSIKSHLDRIESKIDQLLGNGTKPES